MGRFLAPEEILPRHLATLLDGYSLEEPTPPVPLLQNRQGSRSPTIDVPGNSNKHVGIKRAGAVIAGCSEVEPRRPWAQ